VPVHKAHPFFETAGASAYGQFRRFTTSLLDLRPPDSTGHLVILLFFFQFSFFLWSKLGLFLLFSFAFIPFSLITHIGVSLLKNDLRQLNDCGERRAVYGAVCALCCPLAASGQGANRECYAL
jgi:hypothetical protein